MAHSHLDRARRPRGECPGCDADWVRQDALLPDVERKRRTEQSLEGMIERAVQPKGFCTEFLDTGRHTHTCLRAKGTHKTHQCHCGEDWKKTAK
jgi:hypothetical protein